jgi:transmembrane 9 superfamily member 2/4
VVIEVAIVQNYVTLCWEEYRWWWKTWVSAASTGFWLLMIMVTYLLSETRVTSGYVLLTYLVAASMACVLIGLMAASLALYFTFRFNCYIYSRIKSD